eukprot:gene30092-35056_t
MDEQTGALLALSAIAPRQGSVSGPRRRRSPSDGRVTKRIHALAPPGSAPGSSPSLPHFLIPLQSAQLPNSRAPTYVNFRSPTHLIPASSHSLHDTRTGPKLPSIYPSPMQTISPRLGSARPAAQAAPPSRTRTIRGAVRAHRGVLTVAQAQTEGAIAQETVKRSGPSGLDINGSRITSNKGWAQLITTLKKAEISRRLGYALMGVMNGTEVNPNFEQEVQALLVGSDKTCILYCASPSSLEPLEGNKKLSQTRSLVAAFNLVQAGNTNLVFLKGGFQEWAGIGRSPMKAQPRYNTCTAGLQRRLSLGRSPILPAPDESSASV